jgi:nitroreductase
MDVYDCIRTKRAVRRYAPTPIPDDKIKKILNAGRLSGSGNNRQPWEFIVIRDKEVQKRLVKESQVTHHIGRASVVIAVVTDEDNRSNALDTGRTIQNMMLAAWGDGIVSCLSGLPDENTAKQILGIPPERKLQLLISCGYPSTEPDLTINDKPREQLLVQLGRRPLAEIVHWGRYGQRTVS